MARLTRAPVIHGRNALMAEEWPREIWAAELGEFDPVGDYVCSEHATIARHEGDTERDRDFHRYVDGDVLESLEKYSKHQAAAKDAALREALAYIEADLGRQKSIFDTTWDVFAFDIRRKNITATDALISRIRAALPPKEEATLGERE